MKYIKKLIQKIKCSMPFSFSYFLHDELTIVRRLGDRAHLIQCRSCGRRFAINHSVRVILPWGNIRNHYDEMDRIDRLSDISD
jgi:hypothetical protein